MLPNAAPENKNLVFFPYWRFKGMLFSCVSNGIRHRFIDASHQAIGSVYFPFSVGLRSQTLKLRFVSPETEGRFLKPTLSFEKVMRIFEDRFNSPLPHPIFLQSHIGESLSLIYSPYYVDDKIYDAVLNKPVTSVLPDDFDIAFYPDESPGWPIKFIPTLCPNCGWDLHSEREALVLHCSNCNSVWQPAGNGLKRLKFAHIPIPGKGDNVIFLPFWRMKADISEIALTSYADLVKIANLPKAVQEKWKNIGFRFWSPAFKVRHKDFLRLGRNATLSQPREKLVTELPDAPLYPVTLPVTEAVESMKITLTSFIKPRQSLLPRLHEIKIKPKSFLLVYIPFIENHHELIQPMYHLTLNKNVLGFARNL